MDRLLILGAGGFGKVVADIARQSGLYLEVAFLDDGTEGYKVLESAKTILNLPIQEQHFIRHLETMSCDCNGFISCSRTIFRLQHLYTKRHM